MFNIDESTIFIVVATLRYDVPSFKEHIEISADITFDHKTKKNQDSCYIYLLVKSLKMRGASCSSITLEIETNSINNAQGPHV